MIRIFYDMIRIVLVFSMPKWFSLLAFIRVFFTLLKIEVILIKANDFLKALALGILVGIATGNQ